MEKIKTMWEKASRSLTQHQNSIYGVYYDYETDYKGNYSLGVGIEDNGTSFIEIPNTEHYKIFSVDTTDEQGILKAWSRIWSLEEAGTLKRAYTFDYEKYYPNGEIEIYIAIK
ncbi:putative transcriptional regulator YdeE [Peribacillus cavernae]|nr:putative transcriptional regulator YdeE [Peribacillus cavernae]